MKANWIDLVFIFRSEIKLLKSGAKKVSRSFSLFSSPWFHTRVLTQHSIKGKMAMDSSTPSRHEKSLGLLTTKFVSLLQEAKDGVLDLKVVRQVYVSTFHS